MKREQLHAIHEKLCQDARDLMELKNHDYANEADPFRNFRRHGLKGIAVRMSDKLARLEGFIENEGELKVPGETIIETCIDLLNYAVLFAAYTTETKEAHNGHERKL
jgi:hypothetical protein